VDRYSFLVRLSHPLLHAGLARRTNIAITLVDGGFECNRLFSTVMFEGAKDGAYTALVRLHLKVASG
jgi:hypothetical protein